MCGIAGFLSAKSRYSSDAMKGIIGAMSTSIAHRGPDHSGEWLDCDKGIALGHQRLSIIDLSPSGNQPMLSRDGRYVIIFNGEIYNFRELREELLALGHKFIGDSDTEVLLASIIVWGMENALKKSRGMFALALWDNSENRLFLARDRFGEKPLYYYSADGLFLFASELKALHKHPGFNPEINRNMLCLYFRHNYIPAPNCIYKNTSQVLPGTYLCVNKEGTVSKPETYWSFSDVAIESNKNPFEGSEQDAENRLQDLLEDSVREQMISDVPLGAMLSGGIDSSCIVALMQKSSDKNVRTFSVAYDDAVYNEAEYAAEVAKHLGTDHTELHIKSSDAIDLIPSLSQIYDEPFSDASQLPTTLISRLTRDHVTVALTGDAGDELFGGYNRYFWASRIDKLFGHIPKNIRNMISRCLTAPSVRSWDSLFKATEKVVPSRFRFSLPGDKIYKLASVLNYSDSHDLYKRLVSHWQEPESLIKDGQEPVFLGNIEKPVKGDMEFSRRMMYLDSLSYLPYDILCKVDRAAMFSSLETRVPFLDPRIVEFAWSLPGQYLIRGGQGKWLLRQVLYKHVPRKLIDRPKMGFGVPIDSWLRGPLRDWAEDLLDEEKIRQQGYLNPKPIRQAWQEHLSGHRNWQYHIWDVLMFQAWREKWT